MTGQEFAAELNRTLRERRAERELDKNESRADGPRDPALVPGFQGPEMSGRGRDFTQRKAT